MLLSYLSLLFPFLFPFPYFLLCLPLCFLLGFPLLLFPFSPLFLPVYPPIFLPRSLKNAFSQAQSHHLRRNCSPTSPLRLFPAKKPIFLCSVYLIPSQVHVLSFSPCSLPPSPYSDTSDSSKHFLMDFANPSSVTANEARTSFPMACPSSSFVPYRNMGTP